MPTMYEIYEMHADRYHELVSAEDHQGHLKRQLRDLVDWRGLDVIECGTGTGRVTGLYIEDAASVVCCDRSVPMLDFARAALAPFLEKITFILADNRKLPAFPESFDVFIEGWSFGHAAADCATDLQIREVAGTLVGNAMKTLKTGGLTILIETLGTNVDAPGAPSAGLETFYRELEERHGFRRQVIRTDYRFESNRDAVEIMGFFFGEARKPAIRARNSAIIPEWTGIWICSRKGEEACRGA